MAVSPPREALVSRLEQELTAFAKVRDLSEADYAEATDLADWTIVHKPNVIIQMCGMVSAEGAARPSLTMTGRVLHVDIVQRIVVTSCGLYRLGQRQDRDCGAAPLSVQQELLNLQGVLTEYREDLLTVRRYLSEMMSVTDISGDTTMQPLRRALH
ncbi:hypothetical protein HJ526_11125 [Donghicola sp. C2-DW-16]|uniref:Uncharacterized protein n=1 Tax=Donghicola mangrovi TaxID=2729614 RepID=A0ABX2PEP5_9RHOB|nr:hypothetical protein [Donghicola mangrovi]NVO27975.1 hypothetical protein [Donghicola mangrovi]